MSSLLQRPFVRAAMIGFLLPLFWGGLEFVFFNAHESILTRVFFAAAYITCPPWLLPGFWGDIGSPFLNAALYSGVALAIRAVRS